MVEVTQADRDFAAPWIAQGTYQTLSYRKAYRKEIEAGKHDAHPMVIAAATHRLEAAKAERDRLRNLPDELVARVIAGVDKLPRVATNEEAIRMTAAALADALGSQP